MHKIVVIQSIHTFCSDVILMISVRYVFQSHCHRVVGINNTSIFGLSLPNTAAGFTKAIYWCFTRHYCWHRNFKLSMRVFHDRLKFFVIWFNEEDTTSLSCIIEFWFLDSPFLLCFLFRCIRHVLPHIWPYFIRSRGCSIPRESPPRTMYIRQVAFRSIK